MTMTWPGAAGFDRSRENDALSIVRRLRLLPVAKPDDRRAAVTVAAPVTAVEPWAVYIQAPGMRLPAGRVAILAGLAVAALVFGSAFWQLHSSASIAEPAAPPMLATAAAVTEPFAGGVAPAPAAPSTAAADRARKTILGALASADAAASLQPAISSAAAAQAPAAVAVSVPAATPPSPAFAVQVQAVDTPAVAAPAHTSSWGKAATVATAPARAAVRPAARTSGWGAATVPTRTAAAVRAAPVLPAPAAHAVITWPASGPITSYFGPSHPLGIDIGIPYGTPLQAAASGRVSFVGGDPCCSYGYRVDIDHGNGVLTRYGHLIEPSTMVPGQMVRLGDVIGFSGSTGFSTGPHLHFEVRLYDRPVNPLLVLPGGG